MSFYRNRFKRREGILSRSISRRPTAILPSPGPGIAWLEEQGLLRTNQFASLMTERGVDVALGRATVPGVKHPAPRDSEGEDL